MRLFLFLLLLLAQCALPGGAGVVRIGAMYPLFKSAQSSSPFSYDHAGAKRLAAFLLAIEQVNNKTDGVGDELLPGVHLNVSVVDSKRSNGVSMLKAVELSSEPQVCGKMLPNLCCPLPPTVPTPAAAPPRCYVGRCTWW